MKRKGSRSCAKWQHAREFMTMQRDHVFTRLKWRSATALVMTHHNSVYHLSEKMANYFCYCNTSESTINYELHYNAMRLRPCYVRDDAEIFLNNMLDLKRLKPIYGLENTTNTPLQYVQNDTKVLFFILFNAMKSLIPETTPNKRLCAYSWQFVMKLYAYPINHYNTNPKPPDRRLKPTLNYYKCR